MLRLPHTRQHLRGPFVLAALGIANIDTLGVQGGAIHSEEEYLNVRSLIPRAKLSAALMLTLAYLQAEGELPTWVRG